MLLPVTDGLYSVWLPHAESLLTHISEFPRARWVVPVCPWVAPEGTAGGLYTLGGPGSSIHTGTQLALIPRVQRQGFCVGDTKKIQCSHGNGCFPDAWPLGQQEGQGELFIFFAEYGKQSEPAKGAPPQARPLPLKKISSVSACRCSSSGSATAIEKNIISVSFKIQRSSFSDIMASHTTE